MASEYTHQIEAQGKSGDWKPMTKHIGRADATSSLAELKKNPKSADSSYRISPIKAAPAEKSTPKPAVKPAAKAAPKAAAKPVAKPAAKPAAKKAAPKKDAK